MAPFPLVSEDACQADVTSSSKVDELGRFGGRVCHEVRPRVQSVTYLENKKGTFRQHTSVKLWALQFDSEFSDLDTDR